MLLIQTCLAFGIIVLALFVGLFALQDARSSLPSRLLALLSASVATGIFWMLPPVFEMPDGLRLACRILSIPSTGLMWCLVRSILDDDYRFSVTEFSVVVLVSIFPALYCLEAYGVHMPWLRWASRFGSFPPLAAIGYLLWSILRGLPDDLVTPRRRFRMFVVGTILASAALSVLSEELADQQLAQLLRTLAILSSVLLLSIWLMRFQSQQLLFRESPAPLSTSHCTNLSVDNDELTAQQTTSEQKSEQKAASSEPRIDPRDQATVERLRQLMQQDKVYLQPELGISDLAQMLKVPEHQLRVLINRGLGYRNFSQFLAESRITHAKKLLADPAYARRQVLAIAMESGFASLATFNRAFKSAVGITPSDFRGTQLQGLMQQTEKP